MGFYIFWMSPEHRFHKQYFMPEFGMFCNDIIIFTGGASALLRRVAGVRCPRLARVSSKHLELSLAFGLYVRDRFFSPLRDVKRVVLISVSQCCLK